MEFVHIGAGSSTLVEQDAGFDLPRLVRRYVTCKRSITKYSVHDDFAFI